MRIRTVFTLGAFLLLTAVVSLAQYDVAAVLGTVTDASGAVVPNAKVKLENTQTGVSENALTDGSGIYRFLDVRIGRYRVTAQASGFKTATTEEFTATVAARQRVDIRLEVGEASQMLSVTDAVAPLETDSSNRGHVVQHDVVVNMPLNGRSYADLALLSPGVRHSVQGNMSAREAAYNVNGMRSAFNNFIMDGIDNNAYGTSNQGFSYQVVQASPDAVQEFRLDTNNYSAEYGRAAGAVINASVRSGTNQFHGAAWEFLRNTKLNATGFFQPVGGTKPVLMQNQFGGAFGGPVRKDKLFFFVDYEGGRIVSRTPSFLSLPTPNQKQGRLGIAVANPLTGAAYTNGIVPANEISAFARQVLADLPDPNLPVTGGNYTNDYQALPRVGTQSDKGDARVDYYLNSKLNLFGRFSLRQVNQLNGSALPGPDGSGGNTFHTYNRQVALGANWTIGPRTLLDVRLGVSHSEGADIRVREADDTPGMKALYGIGGLPEEKPLAGGLNSQAISGFTSFGRDSGQHQNPEVINPKVNFTRVAGRHTIKTGAEFQNISTEIVDFNPMIGKDTYAGQFSKPKGAASNNLFNLADFLFGARDSYSLNSYGVLQYRQHMFFGYVQDDFKATRELTLNLGMRYEYGSPQYDANNHLSNFDPSQNALLLARNGSIYDRSGVNPDLRDFGPRAGLAYSINTKTVIRSGYGISYNHFNRSGRENLLGYNGPYVVNVAVNQTTALPFCTGNNYTGCFRTTPMGYPTDFAAPANFNTAVANIHYIPKDTRSTYVQSWHFTIQRELARDLVLDVAYVGNRGVHLYQLADYNQARPNLPGGTLGADARRPVANFGIIQIAFNEGLSSYHALQAKLEKRFSRGLYLLNSFAWSKSLDIAPSNMEAANGDNYYFNFRNWGSNKGISNYDQPFQNTTSLSWELPVGKAHRFGSGMNPFVNAAVGGWRVSAINTMTSGLPINFTYTPSTAASVSPQPVYRPNLVGNPFLPADQRSIFQYFNAAALTVPDITSPFGTAGRNIARSDALYTLDLAIQKSFPVFSEGRRLEFRSEMFNALNKTNFLAPASNISNKTFGTITGTFPARQIQLALKFTF
jgi:hypothetical protein